MAGATGTKRKRASDDERPAGTTGSSVSNGAKKGSEAEIASTLDSDRPAQAADDGLQHPAFTLSAPQQLRNDAYYRELYKAELDFRQMARRDPQFAAVMKPTGQLDFSDPVAVMQLTKTTLKLDFGLDISLPDDRLCPPVPNRHNYILWLKSLLDSTSYDEPGGKLTGLDIGTGASCIYPLLGCTQRPWFFIGTDVDEKSLACATENVRRNGLEHRIRLVPRPDATSSPLIPLDELGLEEIDFSMTNPPFYSGEGEMLALARAKARPPSSACTGAPVEMVCPGGEVAFVAGRMLRESEAMRTRVRWYTAMLGRLSSLEAVVAALRSRGVDNFAVAEFVQGSRTRRWAVGWSFGAMRPAPEAARGMAPLAWNGKVLPSAVEVEVGTCAVVDVGATAARVDAAMQALELMSWVWEKEMLRGVARTRGNVWGRAWRRRNLKLGRGGGDQSVVAGHDAGAIAPAPDAPGATAPTTPKDAERPMAGFMIIIAVTARQGTISCRWREGHDESLFQSFCGFLKGKLELAAKQGGTRR